MVLTFTTSLPEDYRGCDPRHDICAILTDAFTDDYENCEADFTRDGVQIDLGDDSLEADTYEDLPEEVRNAIETAIAKCEDFGLDCELDEIIY